MSRMTVEDALKEKDAVLKAFVADDGSLVAVPTKLRKRLVVLDYVSTAFERGRLYDETEVNTVLRSFHPDVAALRRYLIDEGFLSRDSGGSAYGRAAGLLQPPGSSPVESV